MAAAELNYEQRLVVAAFIVQRGMMEDDFLQGLAKKRKRKERTEEELPTPQEVMEKCSEWGITAHLKPHQARGVSWLIQRYARGVNVILGDEMGLGKTLQAISMLVYLKYWQKCKGPFLVLCPLSVTDGWSIELSRFAPSLRVLRYFGSKEVRRELRSSIIAHIDDQTSKSAQIDLPFDVCLTTYELAILDAHFLPQIQWSYTVIDEAQRIKNPSSVLYTTLQSKYMIPRRLLLTGTPIQNNLSELWALLHFCMPQIFDDMQVFTSVFKDVATMKQGDKNVLKSRQYRLLRYVMSAFMLRRTKAVLIRNGTLTLPSLSEVTVLAPLTLPQKTLYASILQKELHKLSVPDAVSHQKQSLQNIVVQLRKACSHPYLFPGVEPEPFEEGEHLVQASGKLIILDILLDKLHSQHHRVLVFAQMTRTIDILQDFLEMRKYSYERLDGSVRAEERFAAVEKFNAKGVAASADSNSDGYSDSEKPFVFLISTHAGGVGLNLTGADTVIFYEQDWNPQVDKQALQRTHRIGQLHHVLSINIVTENTVEEVIMHRAKRKLQLCENVMGHDAAAAMKDNLANLGTSDLHSLLIFGLHKFDPAGSIAEQASVELNISEMKSMAENVLQIREGSRPIGEEKYKIQYDSEDDASIYDYSGKNVSIKKYSDRDLLHGRDADRAAYETWIKKTRDVPLDVGSGQSMKERRSARPLNVKESEEARKEKLKKVEERKHARWESYGYKSLTVECDNGVKIEPILNPGEVIFVFGDCTKPLKGHPNERTIIFSCVDNSGNWGKGGMFNALETLSPKIPDSYGRAHEFKDLHMGDLHLIPISDSVDTDTTHDGAQWVALAVVQSYDKRRNVRRGEISLPHLDICLRKLSFTAFKKSASVHMPRIGFRQGNGHKEWYTIERLLQKYAAAFGINIYVYYYQRPTGST